MYLSVKHVHKSNTILMIQCITDLSTVMNYLHIVDKNITML